MTGLDNVGVSLYFMVHIDELKLATFTGCTGLRAQYESLTFNEGGDNGTVLTLPGRLSYTPVRLTRPVDLYSAAIAVWFAEQASKSTPTSATITLFNPSFASKPPIAFWKLEGAWPLQYTGPTLSTTQSGDSIATETLVLSHQGFAT